LAVAVAGAVPGRVLEVAVDVVDLDVVEVDMVLYLSVCWRGLLAATKTL
jgi:hypothetical protein